MAIQRGCAGAWRWGKAERGCAGALGGGEDRHPLTILGIGRVANGNIARFAAQSTDRGHTADDAGVLAWA